MPIIRCCFTQEKLCSRDKQMLTHVQIRGLQSCSESSNRGFVQLLISRGCHPKPCSTCRMRTRKSRTDTVNELGWVAKHCHFKVSLKQNKETQFVINFLSSASTTPIHRSPCLLLSFPLSRALSSISSIALYGRKQSLHITLERILIGYHEQHIQQGK